MNENKPFNFIFRCEGCEKYFPITKEKEDGPDLLNHKKEFKVDGQSIFLTYYDCPFCGKRHFVQIDDATSLLQFESVKTQFVKISAAKRKGKRISKKQSEDFKKARQDLSDYRTNLMKEFTGKTAVSEIGIDYVLRFSV